MKKEESVTCLLNCFGIDIWLFGI